MTILLGLKLFLAPFFVWIISILQSRYNARLGGLFLGLPLTTGPFLIIIGIQEGQNFAKTAAHGVLVGQLSLIVFCFAYAIAAKNLNWYRSILVATIAVWLSGYIFNLFNFSNLGIAMTLFFFWAISLGLFPMYEKPTEKVVAPKWELPVRLVTTAVLILILTATANILGSRVSGALSTYPTIITVLGTFSHRRNGPKYLIATLHALIQALPITSLIMIGLTVIL
jgi:hypothetical protein